MEIGSVTSGASAYTNTATATRPSEEATESAAARKAEQQQQQREAQMADEKKARPVVNAQGQTTGTNINITA